MNRRFRIKKRFFRRISLHWGGVPRRYRPRPQPPTELGYSARRTGRDACCLIRRKRYGAHSRPSCGRDLRNAPGTPGHHQTSTCGERLTHRLGKAIGRAEQSGRSVRMTVIVDPRGNGPEIEVENVEEAKDELDIALVEARARGAAKVADTLNAGDMLTADQFAELIGATRETVHQKRKRHEVLGLEGPRRGVRSPQLGDVAAVD